MLAALAVLNRHPPTKNWLPLIVTSVVSVLDVKTVVSVMSVVSFSGVK